MTVRRAAVTAAAIAAGGVITGVVGYLGLITASIPVDLNVGRRIRPLGPLRIEVAAPRETVYAAIEAPYAERAPRAFHDKVKVLERGSDLVLAAHYTPISAGLRAVTVETVRFVRPERVDFRLVRGPVPQVDESFLLIETDSGTAITYSGELGTDLWSLGQRWGDLVAAHWEAAVKASLDAVKEAAERRSRL